MNILEQLSELRQKPFFTSKEAREAGVHPAHLIYYAKQGVLERVSRGVYRDPNVDLQFTQWQWEDLFLRAASIPESVICGISGLAYFGMTDEFVRKYSLAIPHEKKIKAPKDTVLTRTRDIETGVEEISEGKLTAKIFNRERLVVEAFKITEEVGIKALRYYLDGSKGHKIDIQKLSDYAKQFRVQISPYLQTMVTI